MGPTPLRALRPARLLELLHGRCIYGRRIERLSACFARHLPPDAAVLDVGAGDGLLASRIQAARPDLKLSAVDVLPRPAAQVAVELYDGRRLPCADRSFDAVIFSDVLHHTADPAALLAEAARVARAAVLVKDHLREGLLAHSTLAFMDRVGNDRFGVALPLNYWPRARWLAAFAALGLGPVVWETRLGLYPPPLSWLFERSLHFFAVLRRA